jgi:hypothetical protein
LPKYHFNRRKCLNIRICKKIGLLFKFKREEMIENINNNEEFTSLKPLMEYISFTDLIYPGNTVNFISASIISKLTGIEKFQI